jgi:hypothetical protein
MKGVISGLLCRRGMNWVFPLPEANASQISAEYNTTFRIENTFYPEKSICHWTGAKIDRLRFLSGFMI